VAIAGFFRVENGKTARAKELGLSVSSLNVLLHILDTLELETLTIAVL